MTHEEKILMMIEMRNKIAIDYCVSKQWSTDFTELKIDQILEIRALDSWKNVPAEIEKMSTQ